MKFSSALIHAIQHVNNDTAHEIDYTGVKSYRKKLAIATEVCLDASSIHTWGYPEEQKELQVLIGKYGYKAVETEASKHVSVD